MGCEITTRYYPSVNEQLQHKAEQYMRYAQVHEQMGEHDKAREYALKAKHLLDQIG